MMEFDVAQSAARAGGDVVARYFHEGVTIRSKESYNLVSDADIEAEQTIVKVIRQAFPDDAVLAEEEHKGDATADRLWVVDPLDGTNNFAHQLPHFAISIAFYELGRAQCGVVYNPVRGDLYTARAHQGAYANGTKIQCGREDKLSEVLIGVGFYYDRGAMMHATLAALAELFGRHIHGIRRYGTASLDLCMVGLGQLGAFFEYELSPWDFAAGRLFVEEAGGRVTDCRGDALPLDKSSVLATNAHLHDAMLAVVEKHFPEGLGTRE